MIIVTIKVTRVGDISGVPKVKVLENICSEDDLRSRIFAFRYELSEKL